MSKLVTYLRHSTSHHAKHSGYSRILDFLPGIYLPGTKSILPYRLSRILSSLASDNAGIYNSNSLEKELQLIRLIMSRKEGIAHFLNGERDIRFSTILKQFRNWKFVATFHQPPEVLTKIISNYKFISRLDGAIAVGSSQLEFLRDKIQGDAIQFIPHGVDSAFFCPPISEICYEPYTCLFVGQHLRDFQTLDSCVEILQKQIHGFKLRAVVRQDHVHLLPKSCQTEIYSGISDEQLRELYQSSSLLLLPLKNVTACNSILEALSCGLPVITTRLESNEAYVNDSCSILLNPGDAKGMADAAIFLMKEHNLNIKMRKNSRLFSENFSWEKIAFQITKYYDTYFE